MSPIREALSCDVTSVTQTEWDDLTEVLDLNSIKTNQDLSGTPTEQYYSSDGIFTHLQDGADYHPMLKYLEEAELELKCLAFESSFDFTNPEGENHCEIHSITQGSGITLPETDTTDDTTDDNPDDTTDETEDICEASPATSIVSYGYNKVLDNMDTEVAPTGRPIQVGYQLVGTTAYVSDQNKREWALIFSLMSPIREALSCDVTSVTQTEWDDLTEVLDLNSIKTNQDLSGTPTEQYYSSDGIFTHLQDGADYHPMLKYLEEAELELKCLAFESSFVFTNPEGDDHCEIHSITQGSGITLPEADTTDDN